MDLHPCSSPFGRSHLCTIRNFLLLVSALRWKITSAWHSRSPFGPSLTNLPLAVPPREDLGKDAYGWLPKQVTGSASQRPKITNAPKDCPSERKFFGSQSFDRRKQSQVGGYTVIMSAYLSHTRKPVSCWTTFLSANIAKKSYPANFSPKIFLCVKKNCIFASKRQRVSQTVRNH